MKKVLFIDRDGTLVIEPPGDKQLDSLDKLEFYPGIFRYLSMISGELDYELVIVTNQDGLGTPSFPETTFWPAHNKMIQAFANEGIHFKDVLVDRSFPSDNAPTRKPGTGMLGKYLTGEYDLSQSFVIGDRITDVQLAMNLGAKAIFIGNGPAEGAILSTTSWKEIYQLLGNQFRRATIMRKTMETDIAVTLCLDGCGQSTINTGIGFFDHMLEQVAKHSGIDLAITAVGDLRVDDHHTIEDVAIALGEALNKALGSKKGIARYGFLLPMDDCLARVAIDLGGRQWIVWDVTFRREKIGDMPTEMFFHFFKSFSDAAKCNINIKAEGINEHHKIEAIFKGFGRALKMATCNTGEETLPTTKGFL
jgi:imidazoleglycerol-phosphate dehydratase/histidinol-phosphatase